MKNQVEFQKNKLTGEGKIVQEELKNKVTCKINFLNKFTLIYKLFSS